MYNGTPRVGEMTLQSFIGLMLGPVTWRGQCFKSQYRKDFVAGLRMSTKSPYQRKGSYNHIGLE